MDNNWVLVHLNSTLNSAQITKSVLENEGINVVIINKKDAMHIHLNNASIEIYVHLDNVITAKYLIQKFNL